MTAAKVIGEMNGLPPEEQAKVIQHAFELARRRQLSADELGDLAERLAASNDPAEIVRLKSAMTRGTLRRVIQCRRFGAQALLPVGPE